MWEITEHDVVRKDLGNLFRAALSFEEKQRLIGVIQSNFEIFSQKIIDEMRECGSDIVRLDTRPKCYGDLKCFSSVVSKYLNCKNTPIFIKKYIMLSTGHKIFRDLFLKKYVEMYLDHISWSEDEEIGMFLANVISSMTTKKDIDLISSILSIKDLGDTRLIILSKFKKAIRELRPDLARDLAQQGAGFAALMN